MHKFAFLVHIRDYQRDLAHVAKPLGHIPESFYQYLFSKRPIPPFIWSEVQLTPHAEEAEGYIIMLPYSGRQILREQRQMLPIIHKAIHIAKKKQVKTIGLGALTSPATLGGKLVANDPQISVTNGNAFTAVTLHRQLCQQLARVRKSRPLVAIVGGAGSVGSLLCLLTARDNQGADLLVVGRNQKKITSLAERMGQFNCSQHISISCEMQSLREADIIVMVTSSTESILNPNMLKPGAIVIDAAQPRNSDAALTTARPDISLLDGGLVSIPSLTTNKVGQLGLPRGISFACMAETMLLAASDYKSDFSIGNPGLRHADMISNMAQQFSHLGFDVAPDHRFGFPATHGTALYRHSYRHLGTTLQSAH